MTHPQVVIIRKDKRIRHKFLHAIAFAVTGGTSSIVTAAEAANHASYNARTRRLQARTETVPAAGKRRDRKAPDSAEWRAEHVPGSREYKARHSQ